MKQEQMNGMRGLFEELDSIVSASSTGNGKEPVWDGTVIGKPNQHTLKQMGLVECVHDYYFPTKLGKAVWYLFVHPEKMPSNIRYELESAFDQ